MTSSIGLFGKDLENTNDTDWAVTGRLTMGGNFYYRKFRVSANILLAETERSVFAKDNGNAVSLRLQYLF